MEGADDIFWVNALQARLAAKGFFCGDDEAEDFFFGSGTRSALETFQACSGLAETGVCDDESWAALYGDELASLRPPSDDAVAAADAAAAGGRAAPEAAPLPPKGGPSVLTWSSGGQGAPATTPAVDTAHAAHHHYTRVTVEESVQSSIVAAPAPHPPHAKWPILREGDGGRDVHSLQVSLGSHGFHCGDDDEQWWQFGDDTHNALITFQACSGLPESGVCDGRTWKALLGNGATPADVGKLTSGDDRDDDMLGNHHDGAVFLLGEQRWARRVTVEEEDD